MSVSRNLQSGLDAGLRGLAPRLSPFYRRFPYEGPLWLTEVDTRGAVSPEDRFFFNRIPKAANSTVIANLVQGSSGRSGHKVRPGREKWYFRRPLFASATTVAAIETTFFRFAFVRDPHTRVLSAFLDKILGKAAMSRAFYRWWGHSGRPGYGDFCRYLGDGGLFDDIHWAPQVGILLLPVDRFDMIGRFENLETDLATVMARIFGDGAVPILRAGPRSDAGAAFADHYDETLLDCVGRLYAADCKAFGYPRPAIG